MWDDPSAKRDAADHVGLLVKDLIVKFQIIYDGFAKDYKQAHDDITSKNEELQQLTAKKSSLQAEANADYWKFLIPFAILCHSVFIINLGRIQIASEHFKLSNPCKQMFGCCF